jgi:hypothetical protein
MRAAFPLLLGAVGLFVSPAAEPHHSFAAEFDISKPIDLTGSVTKIEWTNPHAWFYIDVPGANGATEGWAVEVASANGLLRRGWTRDTVKVGDTITIRGFAARDGTRTGNAAAVIKTSTGEALYASSGDGSAD